MPVVKIDGIDISHWQSEPRPVNFDLVATSGITLFSTKATECSLRSNGTVNKFVDPFFVRHWDGSYKVPTLRWRYAYHWLDFTVDPVVQAQHYLATVGDRLDVPGTGVCLDVEEQQTSAALLREYGTRAAAWCEVVEEATGRPVQLYALKALWGHPRLDNGQRVWWLAWWPSDPDSASSVKRMAEYRKRQPRLGGWQFDAYYSAFPGISENVDVNRVVDAALLDLTCCAPPEPPPPPPPASLPPNVRKGSRGSAVTLLQRLLRRDGFRLVADGVFGPQTEGAVRGFQRKHGLAVDGWVGPQTWGKLRELFPDAFS